MSDQPDVRVGQVWQSTDKRDDDRRLKVLRLDEDRVRVWSVNRMAYEERTYFYAICRRVLNGEEVGRYLRIRLDRFRPTSTGYRLVAYACQPLDCRPAVQAPEETEGAVYGERWTWICEHGRACGWGEEGWEPVMTVEEVGEYLGVAP